MITKTGSGTYRVYLTLSGYRYHFGTCKTYDRAWDLDQEWLSLLPWSPEECQRFDLETLAKAFRTRWEESRRLYRLPPIHHEPTFQQVFKDLIAARNHIDAVKRAQRP